MSKFKREITDQNFSKKEYSRMLSEFLMVFTFSLSHVTGQRDVLLKGTCLMTPQSKKTDAKKKSKVFDKETFSVTRPLPLKGLVNIDNISDREYEIIKRVLDETVARKLKWQTAGLIHYLKNIILKTDIVSTYNCYHEGLNITLNWFTTGKVSIKANNKMTKKMVLDTFIPFKPEVKLNKRIGTSRSMVLYRLFQAIRYQVEGITATGQV